MIATTVAACAVVVTGGVVAGLRSTVSRNLFNSKRRKYSGEEMHSVTELGFATCRFDGARRERRLHLSVIGDVLIFRESRDPSAELVELLPLRKMQASSNGSTIDIEACSHKVSLQLDEWLEADNFLHELEAAKVFWDTAAERMASVREALFGKNTKMSGGEATLLYVHEERLNNEARNYLAKHRFVVEQLSQTFNAMLRHRPPFPHTFLAEGMLHKTEVPFLHARKATPHVSPRSNTTETPKSIQIYDAEADSEREGGQMRRSSLEEWDRADWCGIPASSGRNTPRAQTAMSLDALHDQNAILMGRKMADDNARLSQENIRLKREVAMLESRFIEKTWNGDIPSIPQASHRDLRETQAAHSPLQLKLSSPTRRDQSPSTCSPFRVRDLGSPSLNAASPSRCRNFNSGWSAVV